jgi:hypothetical protein
VTRARQELLARVPTLTEVADDVAGPLGSKRDALDGDRARWVDDVMGRLEPQLGALIDSRLRDLLAPAVQAAVRAALQKAVDGAVTDAVDRFRLPLTDAVVQKLRDLLETEAGRNTLAVPPARGDVGKAPSRF